MEQPEELLGFTLLYALKLPAGFTYFTGALLCLRQSLLKKELRRRLKWEGKKQGSALCDRVFAYIYDSFYFQLCVVCGWHTCAQLLQRPEDGNTWPETGITGGCGLSKSMLRTK